MPGSLELFDHTQTGWQVRLPQQRHAGKPRTKCDLAKRDEQIARQRKALMRAKAHRQSF